MKNPMTKPTVAMCLYVSIMIASFATIIFKFETISQIIIEILYVYSLYESNKLLGDVSRCKRIIVMMHKCIMYCPIVIFMYTHFIFWIVLYVFQLIAATKIINELHSIE